MIKVLVTGGPTRAWLDRVRFLTNVSSGELAFVLCRALRRRGIDVTIVAGPTSQPWEKIAGLKVKRVETAHEMHREVMRQCRVFKPHFAVFTAAVLDFAPAKARPGKVSSKETRWTIVLKPTPKIIDDVGRRFPKVRRIGFKLEWKAPSEKRALDYGRKIIGKKGLDALVLNYLSEIRGVTHPARLMTKDGKTYSARNKREIARHLTRLISFHLK